MSATNRTEPAVRAPSAGRASARQLADQLAACSARLGGDVHEQLVVQAEHDLGARAARPARTVTAHTLNSSAAAPWTTALRA